MIFDEFIRKVRSTPTIRYIESIVNKMIDADYPGMAAEMAFMFILGFFPFLLFFHSSCLDSLLLFLEVILDV